MRPSIPRAAVAALLVVGSLSLAACDGGPACGTHPVCDIRDPSCQAAVWVEAQCARDVAGEPIPPVRVIDVDTYRAELEADLASWEPGPDDPHLDRALDLLDLVPMDATRSETSVDDLVATTGAYFSPADGAITIVDRGAMDDVSDVIVLQHEMVHALQDRAHDLEAFYGEATTHDEAMARSMVIEGEATALMYLYYAGTLDLDPHRVDWRTTFDAWLDAIRGDATPSSRLSLGRMLAYPLGGRSMIHAWLVDPDAPRSAFHAPPTSTFSFFYDPLRGEVAPSPSSVPVCDAPAIPAGARRVLDDTFGATVLYAVAARSGDSAAWELARAWNGDRITVIASADGEHTGIAWRIRVRGDAAVGSLAHATEWFWSQPLHGMVRDGSSLVLYASDDAALFEAWSAVATRACP